MGIDTEIGTVFFTRKGRQIRHVEKHQSIPMDYTYLDTETGREFDVRDLPKDKIGDVSRMDILSGDREAHKVAIRTAIDAGHDFKRPTAAALAEAAKAALAEASAPMDVSPKGVLSKPR